MTRAMEEKEINTTASAHIRTEEATLFQALATAFHLHANTLLLELYWRFNEQL